MQFYLQFDTEFKIEFKINLFKNVIKINMQILTFFSYINLMCAYYY